MAEHTPKRLTDADLRDRFEIRVSDEPGDFDVVLDRLAELLVTIAERELTVDER